MDGFMMDFPRKRLFVFIGLMTCCGLIDAAGFGRFERMFPSKDDGRTTCEKVAQVREYMASQTRHEKSESNSDKQSTAKLPQVSESTTSKPLSKEPTTDRSGNSHSTTKSTTDKPKNEESATEPLSTAQQSEIIKKELSSKSSTTETGLTPDQQTTTRVKSTPRAAPTERELAPYQQTTRQVTSTPPTTPPCAPNMVLGPSCNCARTCQYPANCNCTGPQTCVCPEGFLINNNECVPVQDCGCYYEEGEFVILDGDMYVKDNCTEKCHCSNNKLSCNSTYACGPDAVCKVRDSVRQCYCNDGYGGDGQTCKRLTDCHDAYQVGYRQDGVFTIFPYGWTGSPFSVWCDMTTSGGGWTILQRQCDSSLKFKTLWTSYKNGFGSPHGNYWLGNDKIFYLTNQRSYTLRVDLVLNGSSITYQEYSLFKIANETDSYRLINLGDSNGTAGDGMTGLLGQQFSTMDRDNDGCDDFHCSQKHGDVGWWYSNEWCDKCCDSDEQTCFSHYSSSCDRRCAKANLNGLYDYFNQYGIFWNDFNDITSTEMRILPNMN